MSKTKPLPKSLQKTEPLEVGDKLLCQNCGKDINPDKTFFSVARIKNADDAKPDLHIFCSEYCIVEYVAVKARQRVIRELG